MDKKPEAGKGLGGQISSPAKYESAPAGVPQAPQIDQAKAKEKFDKLKAKLDDLKKKILKKYKFTRSLSLIPAQASQMLEEDEAIPKEIADTKPIHVMMIVPEDQFKNIPKIKQEVVDLVKQTKENIWVHIKTEVDLWNYGLDSKFELIDAVSASFPLHDTGFLGALRVANIHKSLVMRKFEKYVASYVIGGSLVRGTAGPDSDVDTFVIIDDTDVKRMSRIELLEKLRGIIYDYIREATALAGVKNILNVQVYLLTDFWQSVKDAQPVMFTFIRDGIPFYDRGTFIPWKLLLRMGKIKPSPEAIEQYMKQGEQTSEFVKRRLMDAMVDVFWGVTTPTQAMMMLAGETPPVPKTIVQDVKKVLVDREKVMTLQDLKVLEKVVKMYKDYEHGTLKEVPGKEIDSLLKESADYLKNLKELRKKLEIKLSQKTAEEVYEEVFKILKTTLGNKPQNELIKGFESNLIKRGKVSPKLLKVLNDIVSAKQKLKSGKLNQKEVEAVKRDARELIDALVEYNQRADFIATKGTLQISYKGKKAELVLLGETNYLVEPGSIKKITPKGISKSSQADFEKDLEANKGKISTKIPSAVFNILKKELGDFEILF